MDKILPGLYLGELLDMEDVEQITENEITHILSIHDKEKFKIHRVYAFR